MAGKKSFLEKQRTHFESETSIVYKLKGCPNSLKIAAIADHYSSAITAVKTFSASVSMLLGSFDLTDSFNALENAVNNGTLTKERIDQSVLRILVLKIRRGNLYNEILSSIIKELYILYHFTFRNLFSRCGTQLKIISKIKRSYPPNNPVTTANIEYVLK